MMVVLRGDDGGGGSRSEGGHSLLFLSLYQLWPSPPPVESLPRLKSFIKRHGAERSVKDIRQTVVVMVVLGGENGGFGYGHSGWWTVVLGLGRGGL
ncbi:hypothetical protein M8C21_032905 [Ambrosia artemisiifolia]|uniref:Uncharacterized protein n=1 Tax=Ambrosia artemisiifolia TaxID=4212 RepID=A0AAD5GC48_AMBAR|nr:hypothetical protein M8C21_032905 [Ambrosia artemisiifolia]